MLKIGDTIGIVALSGNCDVSKIEEAKLNLEKLGYKVKLSKNIFSTNGYLAGSDDEKIEELYNFFEDLEIKLILNARGGYGAIRLINKIDYERIKQVSKPFCGFSDITSLLLMFYKKCGFITYHGPMASSDFANPFNEEAFFELLKYINKDEETIIIKGEKIIIPGEAKGVLWGGNLSSVVSLCGQDFIPDEGFIFFAEDLNEPVYKIDKMFTQLFNIEKFRNNCKGIILGDFLNIDNKDLLDSLLKSFKVPTVSGFKITHNYKKNVIPIGKYASLESADLSIYVK